jgi:hypothetical protein
MEYSLHIAILATFWFYNYINSNGIIVFLNIIRRLVHREGLALSIGHNWVGSTWRRR